MKRGFTLVELLVVIAIIIALLAILLPSMGKAQRAAQTAVCGSNLHQLTTAQLAYAADHFGKLPPTGYWADFQAMMYIIYEFAGGGSPKGFSSFGILQPAGYINMNSDAYFCPLQTDKAFMQSNGDPDPVSNNALPNALPQDMTAADKAKYAWTNKRSGYLRRNHGESATSTVSIANLKPGGLMADAFSTFARVQTSHADSLNVASVDSSVKTQRVDPVAVPEYLQVNYTTTWNPQFETIWKSFGN